MSERTPKRPESRARAPFAPFRGMRPLGQRNYALFWFGHATSNSARWIEITGSVWLMAELASSPYLLGLLGLARAIPSIVLSPLAGVIADRADERRLLYVTQGASGAASLAIAALILTGAVQPWHVLVGASMQATSWSLDAAARQALFPRLVTPSTLVDAVTLTSIAARSASLVGPALGGLIIARYGEASPFVLFGVLAVFVGACLAAMQPVVRRPPTAASFRVDLIEGVRHIWRAPVLRGLLRLEVVFSLLQLNPVMITILGREVLQEGAGGVGALLSAPALGAVLAMATLLVIGSPSRSGRFIIVCVVAYAATMASLAIARDFFLVFAALALSGLFDSLATVTRHSVMQVATPDGMRGRVMANMGVVTRGVGPLAQTQSGVLAGLLGPPLALVTASAVLTVAAGATAKRNWALWRFRREHAEGPSGMHGR